MNTRRARFSCVVDRGAVFPAQAMRWARSLIEIAGVLPEDIVIHHTREVVRDDVARFQPLGVNTCAVDAVSYPYPHLNKLAQLQSDFLRGAEPAVLCDCDTVFVADPRPYLPQNAVAAAAVDLPNPPMEIWDTLLDRAGLTRQRPDMSVGSGTGMTVFENRNGGLYVLPGHRLTEFDGPWRRWAQWLEGQLSVLGRFAYHIDQIAFAMTCLELRIEPELLPKPLNFPTHLPAASVGDAAPIVLHYHRRVSGEGRLKPLGQPTVDRAIAFANERLANAVAVQRKRRLVLHVGLPKTGTSSLQQWCAANSERLLLQGIRYPTPNSDTQMPKHQFVVSDLLRGDLTRTSRAVAEGDEDCVVLSSEGLTNHLYDFRPAGLERMRGIFEPFDVSVFLVHRRPEDWLRSYHKQCEINPRIVEYHYGLGLDLEEFRRLPRVARLMNVSNLVQDCRAAFGAGEVVAADYKSDWLERFLALCGYAPEGKVELRNTNQSVPDWILDAVLRINRRKFTNDARVAWLATLQRFSKSGHVGLRRHEMTATARNLWREIDPSLAEDICSADECWEGYRDLLNQLKSGVQAPEGVGRVSCAPDAVG